MPDTPEIPETAPAPSPDATPDAPAPRPEPGVADTARLLAQHFPALFGAGVIKPIKLRIQADIHQRVPGVFTKKSLSIFLQRHTTATAYLRALVAEGAARLDLDGHPAGDIAVEHRDAAAAELERRRAIVEARRLAAREAARASRRDARQDTRQDARPARPGASDRPGRPARERKPARAPDRAAAKPPAQPPTPERSAEAEARHQRALLLRSFEQSPLSKANFAALKGLAEDALDALLAQARHERGSR